MSAALSGPARAGASWPRVLHPKDAAGTEQSPQPSANRRRGFARAPVISRRGQNKPKRNLYPAKAPSSPAAPPRTWPGAGLSAEAAAGSPGAAVPEGRGAGHGARQEAGLGTGEGRGAGGGRGDNPFPATQPGPGVQDPAPSPRPSAGGLSVGTRGWLCPLGCGDTAASGPASSFPGTSTALSHPRRVVPTPETAGL